MTVIRRNGSVHQLQGILCPACGMNASMVKDSREIPGAVRRRRECVRCGGRWTTIESVRGFTRWRKGKKA
ncbi:hypothetical protein SAMN05880593_13536 [Rhizobium sp. RU36D]|nr:hypothetical protein SAMN05880593_13536 [Rhizobium sp. RU36D]